MSLVSRLTISLHSYWQSVPKNTLPVFAFLGTAVLATCLTSDFRIRASVIVGAGSLLLLTRRIQKLFMPQVPHLRLPPPQIPLILDYCLRNC